MCWGGSDDAAIQARQQQIQQEGKLKTGTAAINKAYAGFDDAFYKQRALDYNKYAAPEFARQYQQNRNQMIYGLADRGSLVSGAAQEQANALARARNQEQQNIADTGVAQANALRQSIEQQRASLVSQLAATGDPAQTTQQALSTAASFSAPSTFQPLGQLFGNFANTYLARQYANTYAPVMSYYQNYGMPSGTGGYAPPPSFGVK